MENTHGDRLLDEVNGHIERCGQLGMAALADGQTFVAGQAFTACKLAERVRDVLAGSTPARNVELLPFDKPPSTEKKPRAPRKPKAATLPNAAPEQDELGPIPANGHSSEAE